MKYFSLHGLLGLDEIEAGAGLGVSNTNYD